MRNIIIFAATLCYSLAVSAAEVKKEDVKSFVSNLSNKVFVALKENENSFSGRQEAFENIFSKYGDVPKIARFVSGKAWRKSTDEQKSKYVAVYKKYMAFTYAARITGFSDQKVKIGRIVNNNRNLLVHSKIIMPAPEAPISLIWQLTQRENILKVVDLNIENISMSMTQRSEFEPILAKNNFSLDRLTAILENRMKKASEDFSDKS